MSGHGHPPRDPSDLRERGRDKAARERLRRWSDEKALAERERERRRLLGTGRLWSIVRVLLGGLVTLVFCAVIGFAIGAGLLSFVSILFPGSSDYPAQRIENPDGSVSCRTESPPGELVNPWRDPCSRLRFSFPTLR